MLQNHWKVTREPGDTGFLINVYSFTNTMTTGNLTFTKTGTYYIKLRYTTVSNDQVYQCTKTVLDSFVVDSADSINLNYAAISPTCYTTNDGSVTFKATSLYEPLLYQFSNGAFDTITHFEGLWGQSYSLIIKNARNCAYKFYVQVPLPPLVKFSVTPKAIACYNSTGSLKVKPVSGTPPFLVKLNQGAFDTIFNFTSLTPNTYKLILKDSAGCLDSQVVILNNPAPFTIGQLKGQSRSAMTAHETYIATNLNDVRYKWTATKGTVVGEDSLYLAIVHWDSTGIGSVKVTATNKAGCNDSASMQVYLNHVGLDELAQSWGLKVYPNPIKGSLNIDLTHIEQTDILLYDVQGNLLLKQVLKPNQQINTETLAPGIYILKIGEWTGQVVKE